MPIGTDAPAYRIEVPDTAELRVLGEHIPRLEHRHGDRWIRMERTIPMITDRYPRSCRGTWRRSTAGSWSCMNGGRRQRRKPEGQQCPWPTSAAVARRPIEHPGNVLEQLEPAVEPEPLDQVERDVGIPVEDRRLRLARPRSRRDGLVVVESGAGRALCGMPIVSAISAGSSWR
jgi:hypothetical protein